MPWTPFLFYPSWVIKIKGKMEWLHFEKMHDKLVIALMFDWLELFWNTHSTSLAVALSPCSKHKHSKSFSVSRQGELKILSCKCFIFNASQSAQQKRLDSLQMLLWIVTCFNVLIEKQQNMLVLVAFRSVCYIHGRCFSAAMGCFHCYGEFKGVTSSYYLSFQLNPVPGMHNQGAKHSKKKSVRRNVCLVEDFALQLITQCFCLTHNIATT